MSLDAPPHVGARNVGAARLINSNERLVIDSERPRTTPALLQNICVVNLAMNNNSSLRQPHNPHDTLMLNARASASAEVQLLLQ